MNARISTSSWNGIERRSNNNCRRRNPDRRNPGERRLDPRKGNQARKLTLLAWLRSLTRGRLGVDRRKGAEQRMFERRCSGARSLLTKEELEALLK